MSDAQPPTVLELPGGWCVDQLTADEWREAVKDRPLQRFSDFKLRTPFVYVVFRRAPNTQPAEASLDIEGTFIAPCAVPEDSAESLFVALVNAMAHEALEVVQVEGKPLFDPHTQTGDYMLVRTLTKWLEWKTGQRVVLEDDQSPGG